MDRPAEPAARSPRSPARIAVSVAVGATVLLAAAVAWPLTGGDDRAPRGRGGTAYAGSRSLESFDSCDAVLRYFTEQAPEYLIERVGGGRSRNFGVFGGIAEDSAASGAAEAGAAAEPPAYSTTNVQEAGVDEPDLVKTDGTRIVAVAQQRVHLVGLDDGRMRLRATLPEPGVRNVFLSGERLLVFSGQAEYDFEPGMTWPGQRSVLTMYDIADLSDPDRIASLTVDGQVLDARMVGTQVRVATASSPDVDAPSPVYTFDGRLSAKSKRALRDAVARTTVDDWVPRYTLRDGSGTAVGRGRLVECPDLARPVEFSGLDTVAVSSFDMGSALEARTAVGVIAGGQQIYATDTSTYVASTEWSPEGFTETTSLHKFVTAEAGTTAYRGSGEVPGNLLDSYALSEYEGVLRVASTVSENRGWTSSRSVTEGVVTTLAEQAGELRQLGQVGGLGREDNESIQAVRFIEQRAYVVTFRRTDPLYVLDLSEPTAPEVVGELKIPGYSGYLHPIGADRLLGVGQSGQNGVQFSLFDITDPATPRRIDTQTYESGAAAAEFDPRAFLYWEPRNLVLAPTYLYGGSRGQHAFSGLVLLRATAGGLTELGLLALPESDGMANRSVVIDDTVYLLSDQALQAHRLDTHQQTDRLVF